MLLVRGKNVGASVAKLLLHMHRKEVPIVTPCGADWSEMSVRDARERLCAACDKVVHDLSARGEHEVSELVAAGPVCVRYLYDRHGNIVFGALPERTQIVSAGALLSKLAKKKWMQAAAIAGAAIVFEACGGNDGVGSGYTVDAGREDPAPTPTSDPGRTPAVPVVDAGDAGADAADDADAGEPDAGE